MAPPPTSTVEPLPPQSLAPSRWRRRLLLRLSILALICWLLWYPLQAFIGSNVHTVIPGKVYRGAQPSGASLRSLVQSYGIRTVVNLRGSGNPQDWYLEEAQAAQEMGIGLEDITFSASRWPSRLELRELVDVLEHSAYPLFMHCRQGVDRTGLAAVIAQILLADIPYVQARRQMSMTYGHAPIGRPVILDGFFDLYEDWLKQEGRPHDQAAFRRWLLEEYRGGPCQGAIEEVTPLAAPQRVDQPISFRVRVRNLSQDVWQFKALRTAGYHVGFVVWDCQEKCLMAGRAGLFEKQVGPDETLTVTLVAPPLHRPGRYRMLIDLVKEDHGWFNQFGWDPHIEEFDVSN